MSLEEQYAAARARNALVPDSFSLAPRAPEYDPAEGRVIVDRYFDGAVRAAVEVRRGLEDAAVLEAVIIELARRGYVVTPPADRPGGPRE